MKLIWDNGSPELEKRVGNHLVGIRRGGSRPKAVQLTWLDLQALLKQEEPKRSKYLRSIMFALKYEKDEDAS